jgi:hypothetical protein
VQAVDVTHIVLDVELGARTRHQYPEDEEDDWSPCGRPGHQWRRTRSISSGTTPLPLDGMGDLVNENGFSDHFPITMTHSEAD